jgi:hypothetical protein
MGNKVKNCEVTPQAIWSTAKSLTKRDGPKAPSAIHGPLSPTFYSIDKANIIADCLENQLRAHDLYDCDHSRRVEAQVEALLATIVEDIPVNFQPRSIRKEIQTLNLGKSSGFDGIQK